MISTEVHCLPGATEWYRNIVEKKDGITLSFLLQDLEVPLASYKGQLSGTAHGEKLLEISPKYIIMSSKM